MGSDRQPCAERPQVGPFTVQVVEMTHKKAPPETAESVPQGPERSVMLRTEFFGFTSSQDTLPHAIVALRHYARGDKDILEWDTVFDGGQLILSETQVRFENREPKGQHLKTIWRERDLGQGAAHTVIAETIQYGQEAGAWHVLRYGLRSEAHGTATPQGPLLGPVRTRLGLLQEARQGAALCGPLALWNGELGLWEAGHVRTIDLSAGASLQHLLAGFDTPRVVVWSATESADSLVLELSGAQCIGLQIRRRGPWARPMHPDVWERLDFKWRRDAPVNDPGARARAIQATAPFFDKREHKVPTWHQM